MLAMVLEHPGAPLVEREYPVPSPADTEVLIRVQACGVCRTDLHIMDSELPSPKLPLVPGHEIVGLVEKVGAKSVGLQPGQKVGVPWLGGTCNQCAYCLSGRENLCAQAVFTGYLRDGGYAQYALADYRYCFTVPEPYQAVEAAPLLCAGLIGWRALKLSNELRAEHGMCLRYHRHRRLLLCR